MERKMERYIKTKEKKLVIKKIRKGEIKRKENEN